MEQATEWGGAEEVFHFTVTWKSVVAICKHQGDWEEK